MILMRIFQGHNLASIDVNRALQLPVHHFLNPHVNPTKLLTMSLRSLALCLCRILISSSHLLIWSWNIKLKRSIVLSSSLLYLSMVCRLLYSNSSSSLLTFVDSYIPPLKLKLRELRVTLIFLGLSSLQEVPRDRPVRAGRASYAIPLTSCQEIACFFISMRCSLPQTSLLCSMVLLVVGAVPPPPLSCFQKQPPSFSYTSMRMVAN